MRTRPLPFFSHGDRLDADLHLPDDAGAGAPYPVLIPASGFQGLKDIHPARFARVFSQLGYAVLAFDYAGFGDSEGERGRLAPQQWVENLRGAVDRVHEHEEIDADRIGLLGWGLGGGVVVAEAADDPRVRAVAALNGIGDGTRSTKMMHDAESWQSLQRRIRADRGRRAEFGRSEITSPWDIVRLDLDAKTEGYVNLELYQTPGFGSGVTLESADMLLRFQPEAVAHRISPRPLLVVHGAENRLHLPEEARSLYEHAAEPKELMMLPGHGHTEWMYDDNPTFQSIVHKLDGFYSTAFANPPAHASIAS
ncbi:hypothetical protein EV191_106261 [Tamaricihabitans halophyticus]|uniref:Serine aminopeptidase S33 domain-containing protein n=1 Tax=Tamaricihabitans halophyticus TaxID=1262583 RepID=A0A4R2QY64_9PSEU|nr:alpha/beta hydrolase [Tamaricihabitans halophyticus]TCP52095.1 hypothetical protein EV191_106261 [Tamaricihabitans halophyticus]